MRLLIDVPKLPMYIGDKGIYRYDIVARSWFGNKLLREGQTITSFKIRYIVCFNHETEGVWGEDCKVGRAGKDDLYFEVV
ncbi:MAG: hypothetical protein ACYTF1_21745 [Planctomycetota bacterium]|jgi:hypothetical protein